MGKIIAIGGGEIGRPGYLATTTKIDKEIIRLSGKKCPKILFIPTASLDSEGYIKSVEKHFGKRLGCKVDSLCLIKEKLSSKEISKKILSSDIVYVGGGNTLRMMNVWRKFKVDKILKKAYENGIVLSGLIAGSICWFKGGNSDSRKIKNKKAKPIKVKGLGFINALCCPHYDIEKYRKKSLKEMMKKTAGVAIALENCSALEIVDDNYRLIISKHGKRGYEVFWNKGKFYKIPIKPEKKLMPIRNLLNKFI